jgi:TetR/AcrR family transcriptional repressor of nem operon
MRNSEITKKKIITSSSELFNTKGYRATSLSDITQATKLTKGAIYGHFENKDEMAEAAFEFASQEIMSMLQKVIRQAPTAPEKLKAIASHYMDYVLNPPIKGGCPVINTSIEADDNFPQLRVKAIRTIGIIRDSIKKILYRGIKEGQVSSNCKVEAFATKYYSAIMGAIVISRVEGDINSYETVYRELCTEIDQFTINEIPNGI